jgi:hypothetical protein
MHSEDVGGWSTIIKTDLTEMETTVSLRVGTDVKKIRGCRFDI